MDLGALLVKAVVIMAGVNAITWLICCWGKIFRNPSLMLQNPYYESRNKTKLLNLIQFLVVGFIMFGDTLGIGGNAPHTALMKLTKCTDERLFPGTLNTASLVGSATETILFVSTVEVDPWTLVGLIACVTIGTKLGAKYTSKLPIRPIRFIIGFGLAVVTVTMILRNLGLWVPGTGMEIGLYGIDLIIGCALFFVVGLLAAGGVGGYAFMIAICYGLGMDPRCAFPIMFGSYTFLMLASGLTFLKNDALDYRANLFGNIGGVVGVILAYTIFQSMPINVLFWVIVVVLFYSSATMLYAAFKNTDNKVQTRKDEEAPAAE
ncbi:MAG: sulfite exporter TauE/SafE family protein [Firmicutes bacterium]|nr:sulfite exporter TauE/SafE family protein [Bacillota bacterium]